MQAWIVIMSSLAVISSLFWASNRENASVMPPTTPKPTLITPAPISKTPTVIVKPTQIPTIKPQPTPIEPTTVNINDLIYQPSQIVNQSSNSVTLSSSDSQETITLWYKNRLTDLKYPVNTFVKTNSNGKILNKLAISKDGAQISVEVSQDQGSSKTFIKIISS